MKFNEHTEMNGIKIINRKLLANFAKEIGLNASHLEALGESRQWEIVVDGDMLERLVEIQHRFERLAVMGDDEYPGFYIEVPRPTPEEWGGDAEELIALGEYNSREVFLADWLAFNPMEARWFHVASSRYGAPGQSVLRTGSGYALSLRIAPSVRMQSQMVRGTGRI